MGTSTTRVRFGRDNRPRIRARLAVAAARLDGLTMSSLFRITPHPGQDITPAAREFNGNFTVFVIG